MMRANPVAFLRRGRLIAWAVLLALTALGLVILTSPSATVGEAAAPPVPVAVGSERTAPGNRTPDMAIAAASHRRDLQAVDGPGITVDLVYDAIWGVVAPGSTVTMVRSVDGAYGAAEADGMGFFWTPLWRPSGRPAAVAGSGTLQVYVDGELEAGIPIVDVAGGIDVLADTVVGSVTGVAAGTPVTVTLGVDGAEPSAGAPQATASTGAGGGFTASYPGVDLGPANLAAVDVASGGGRVRTYVYPNDRVFAMHNARVVVGYADPGQQVDITVYQGSGPGASVRLTSTTTTLYPHGFYQDWGLGGAQAGDLVEVDLGNGEVLQTVLADLGITSVNLVLDEIEGTAPAGEPVTLRLWQEGGYTQATVTTDGAGAFSASLSGLRARDWFRLARADSQGNESALRSGAPHLDIWFDATTGFDASDIDCLMWRIDAPGVPVTFTLATATGTYTRAMTSDAGNAGSGFCYVMWRGSEPTNFSPGDVVTLTSPAWEGSLVIPEISWYVDSDNDEVTGEAPPGDVDVTIHNGQHDRYPIGSSALQAATRAGSDYTATFSDFDIRDGGSVNVHHYDLATDFGTWVTSWQPWEGLQYQGFGIDLGWGIAGTLPVAGDVVTISLYSSDGQTLVFQTTEDSDDHPWRFWFEWWPRNVSLPAGHWVTVTSESGWEAGLQIPEVDIRADVEADLISGTAPKSLVLVHYDEEPRIERLVPVDDYILDVGYFGGDVQEGDGIDVWYTAPSGNRVRKALAWPTMRLDYTRDALECDYPEGRTFWITVTNSLGAVKATANPVSVDGGGSFGWPGFEVRGSGWSPPHIDLRPGDRVLFDADDGYQTGIRIGSIAPNLDALNDRISGILYAPWFTQTLQGEVRGEWWGMGGAAFEAEPDGGGFAMDVSPNDIVSGTRLSLRYYEPDGDAVERDITAVDPSELGFKIGVNYVHDWVNGHCGPGHTIRITVTASDGHTVEATGIVTETGQVPGWGGDTGFDWQWVAWDTPPDIDPGEWVNAEVDNGEIRTVHVGTIDGHPDAGADSIEGTIHVPDLEDVVRVTCAPWSGAPAGVPRKEDLALPDDVDTYRCAWNPDTEWDLEPEQTIGVWYAEPDGDEVFSDFEITAPTWEIFLPVVMRGP
ncbi:MAG: hypothetical protein JXC32_02255 [Anaerolineae bacterium]|nr:hypothetical protein [Anaerolineae bacterium]